MGVGGWVLAPFRFGSQEGSPYGPSGDGSKLKAMPETIQTLPPEPASPPASTVIDCAAYCCGVRVADVGLDQIHGELQRDDQFVWLGLYVVVYWL